LVLVFVGAKMALVDVLKLHPGVSLAVVLAILATGVLGSLLRARAKGSSTPARSLT
jgi:tellurite resistance protein TerC